MIGSRSIQASRFIGELLQPLPGDQEQADAASFRRELKADEHAVWHAGMNHVMLAGARHAAQVMQERLSGIEGPFTPALETWRESQRARRRQCMIPAPTAKEVRWKERAMCTAVDGIAEIVDAIRADKQRLANRTLLR